jgi:hypothetical protein
MSDSLTPRVIAALTLLETRDDWMPAQFAYKLFPDNVWVRASNNYGLGSDSSGRTGGRILNRLERLGLARFTFHEGYMYYTVSITSEGRKVLRGVTNDQERFMCVECMQEPVDQADTMCVFCIEGCEEE